MFKQFFNAFMDKYFHQHEWVIIQKADMYGSGKTDKNSYPLGIKYTMQCKKCGEIKYKENF